MIETIDALDAWCPPTLMPDEFGRTLLAWWMIEVASHSTRFSRDRASAVSSGMESMTDTPVGYRADFMTDPLTSA